MKIEYTIEDIIAAAQYGFKYAIESQNDGKSVPVGNIMQWMMNKKGLITVPKDFHNIILSERIKGIMSILPPSYSELGIVGGDKYIQHIPDDVEKAQSDFLKLCSEELKNDIYIDDKIHRQGIIGRYLDDCGIPILYKVWNRFMCIDELYREWEQPYYAFNFKKYNETNSECVNKKNPKIIQYFRDRKIENIL
jgi:hypothetical protein